MIRSIPSIGTCCHPWGWEYQFAQTFNVRISHNSSGESNIILRMGLLPNPFHNARHHQECCKNLT
jgi:hypothetical protein